MTPLSAAELDQLRAINTPTISNAIEVFNLRPRNQGCLSPDIRCLFPELGPMVGYAVTAAIRADRPAAPGEGPHVFDWWDLILQSPAPRVAVIQDLDPASLGSFWGEVNGNIHRALGCVGVVTSGGVRDLDEVRQLGFHFFAAAPLVSHAYVHLVDIGIPVKIGGTIIRMGDLIHADQHGAIVIPYEIARQIPRAVQKVDANERPIINACKAADFRVERLKEVWSAIRGAKH